MTENLAHRTVPRAAVGAAVVAAAGLAALLLAASPAVAASERVLFEWVLSSALVGVLAFAASARLQAALRVLAGIGLAAVYLAARITLALFAGLP